MHKLSTVAPQVSVSKFEGENKLNNGCDDRLNYLNGLSKHMNALLDKIFRSGFQSASVLNSRLDGA